MFCVSDVSTKCLQEERKMAMFAQYAMAATEEALEDAGWKPTVFEQREATVRFPWRYPLERDTDL